MRNNPRWKGYNNPAKTFLCQYRALSVQLESIKREVERKRESLTSITAPLKPDVIKSSGAGDRMAEAIAQIVDAEEQFAEIVGEITKAQKEIMGAINSVENATEKAVLMLRYVEGLDWLTVAERIGYEISNTYIIHGRALVGINKWLEQNEKSKQI